MRQTNNLVDIALVAWMILCVGLWAGVMIGQSPPEFGGYLWLGIVVALVIALIGNLRKRQ